jgi:transposase-like protein
MLVSAAVEARAVIFIPSRPGQFVLESEPLAIISPATACAKETKCLVPAFDGAYFSHEWKEHCGAGSTPGRHHDRGDPSSDTALSREAESPLARRHGINPKTVAKWRKRCSAADLRTGPKHPRSTVQSVEQEAVIVAFRRHTLLPLDDCLYALQATIPELTRSSLHRCLELRRTAEDPRPSHRL